MRKLGLLLVSIVVLCSCEPEHPTDYLTIAGKLENNKDSFISITGAGVQKKIKVNKDGSFKDSLKVDKSSIYSMSTTGRKRAIVHLKNGYDLYLTGDSNNFFKSFKFEGKKEGAESNNLIVQRFIYGQTAGNSQSFLVLEKQAFLDKVNRVKKGMDSISNVYNNANKEMVQNYSEQNDKFFQNMIDNYDTLHDRIVKQQAAMARLEKGKPAPEFNDYENFKGGTSSLKDYKGNYVYIDVWATWCKPCIAQIPYLKKLEEEYKGKNIKFVSISTDDARRSNGSWEKARGKWTKMVKEKNLGGIQLWAGEDDINFSQKYQISGIPRFILIDPDGNIVNSNEMRPSSPSINNYFDGLGVQ